MELVSRESNELVGKQKQWDKETKPDGVSLAAIAGMNASVS